MKELFRTRRIFLAVLFLGLLGMAARNVLDPDVWWHLKAGEWIAQNRTVPHVDLFSYTRAGQPWVAHEWLSELFIYGLYRFTGSGGLIIVFAAIHCAVFLLLYLRCGERPYVSGMITLWGACATTPTWGVRPQALSLLVASLWLLILERSERDRKLLWWTLPLTVLWVNLHAGFALGSALLGVFLLGESVETLLKSQSPASNQRLGALALGLLLNLALIPLNPNGTKMFSYPFDTLRSKTMQAYISEWSSPNFHSTDHWAFLLLILAVLATLAWSRTRVRPRDLLLLLATTFAALSSLRMIPIFVLIAVPILSRLLGPWPDRSRSSPRSTSSHFVVLNAAIVLAVAAFAGIHTCHVIHNQSRAEVEHFPAGAVSYLRAHPPAGHIFNHYDWGGYIIFKLYPGTRVFIDGRADLYGERLTHQFVDSYYLLDGWHQPLWQWNITSVIVPPHSALAAGLRSAPGWRPSYEDSGAVIFSH